MYREVRIINYRKKFKVSISTRIVLCLMHKCSNADSMRPRLDLTPLGDKGNSQLLLEKLDFTCWGDKGNSQLLFENVYGVNFVKGLNL